MKHTILYNVVSKEEDDDKTATTEEWEDEDFLEPHQSPCCSRKRLLVCSYAVIIAAVFFYSYYIVWIIPEGMPDWEYATAVTIVLSSLCWLPCFLMIRAYREDPERLRLAVKVTAYFILYLVLFLSAIAIAAIPTVCIFTYIPNTETRWIGFGLGAQLIISRFGLERLKRVENGYVMSERIISRFGLERLEEAANEYIMAEPERASNVSSQSDTRSPLLKIGIAVTTFIAGISYFGLVAWIVGEMWFWALPIVILSPDFLLLIHCDFSERIPESSYAASFVAVAIGIIPSVCMFAYIPNMYIILLGLIAQIIVSILAGLWLDFGDLSNRILPAIREYVQTYVFFIASWIALLSWSIMMEFWWALPVVFFVPWLLLGLAKFITNMYHCQNRLANDQEVPPLMIIMVNRFMTPQPQHQQIHRTEIEIPGIV